MRKSSDHQIFHCSQSAAKCEAEDRHNVPTTQTMFIFNKCRILVCQVDEISFPLISFQLHLGRIIFYGMI